MKQNGMDFSVQQLGKCTIPSPMANELYVGDEESVLYCTDLESIKEALKKRKNPPMFEKAGPRSNIYFDPSKLKCGIVTCGGLCPGINDVIRAIYLSLHFHYNVQAVFGFRYGYEGLAAKHRHVPIELTPKDVDGIHQKGGTILGSSRGPQEVSEVVDTLERMNVGLLFAIGGDGTLRGAHAITQEIQKRNLKIGVVGVPKTIDNDIAYVERTFGLDTAVAQAGQVCYAAHVEAVGARNGIGLVKLMGRESGFIAAYASLANSEINFCLVPEVPFSMEAFLSALKERIDRRHHAVVVVGEGAGQELMQRGAGTDKSGNPILGDIGVFLKKSIVSYFKQIGMEVSLKYIDPSYIIRGMPASPRDSIFCLQLGHNAVHAGMTGRTDMVVGYWKNEFTHVPIPLAVSERKKIDPKGRLWHNVIDATGQPRDLV